MVRPQLEYAAAVWDPYYQIDIQLLEKIQRRAARWVLHDYNRYSSVTSMLQHLNWPTLETRRQISRLQILHKALHKSIALSVPSYYLPKSKPTRHHHPNYFITPFSATTCHQSSFFSRTIRDWNYLPRTLIDIDNSDSFISNLSNYML